MTSRGSRTTAAPGASRDSNRCRRSRATTPYFRCARWWSARPVSFARRALGARLGARLRLRVLLVRVRTLLAQAAHRREVFLRDRPAGVAHDEPAHDPEADHQRAADDEQ